MAIKRATLGSRWASATDVSERLRRARENREAQRTLIASLDERTQRRREELERTLSNLPPSQRTSLADRAAGSMRGDLKRSTVDTRMAQVRAATELAEEAAQIRNHYTSPVQMLMRASLGSERRSRLLQQIEASGPTELASLAELAAATRDEELAAALCSRISTLKASERPFSAHDLAGVLYGEECRKISASLMEIERLGLEVAQADQEFSTGRKNAAATVQLALLKRDEAEVLAGPSAADPAEA